jgi:hypothetical protein
MDSRLAFLSAGVIAAIIGVGPSAAADLAERPKQSSSVSTAGAGARGLAQPVANGQMAAVSVFELGAMNSAALLSA